MKLIFCYHLFDIFKKRGNAKDYLPVLTTKRIHSTVGVDSFAFPPPGQPAEAVHKSAALSFHWFYAISLTGKSDYGSTQTNILVGDRSWYKTLSGLW